MDELTAKQLARQFLASSIELTVCRQIPPEVSVYPADPEDVIVIRFELFDRSHVGPSAYVTVSKRDGTVRFVGHQGE